MFCLPVRHRTNGPFRLQERTGRIEFMKRFASGTEVSTDRSRAEIDRLLTRYGAASFIVGQSADRAMIVFEMHGKRIKFILPLPDRNDKRFTHYKKGNSSAFTACPPEMSLKKYEQENRERWRALVLCIKAKLESVESKIESFEEAFLPHIVMANGQTIGETLIPQLPKIVESGRMPALLSAAH